MNYLTKTSLLLVTLFLGNMTSQAGENQTPMKELKVKKITTDVVKANDVPAMMNEANVSFQAIDVANWSTFPYRPEVSFRIAYTDHAVLLHYKVKEKSVRARYGRDDDPVYTDSCVEFFIQPAGDDIYYNFECNCVGTLLIGAGAPGNRVRATAETAAGVDRWASLGRTPFEEQMGEKEWEVALVIPYTTFFQHQITALDGVTARANFYKCGDELATPHFLSWNPIDAAKPNFHLPEFFGTLRFQ